MLICISVPRQGAERTPGPTPQALRASSPSSGEPFGWHSPPPFRPACVVIYLRHPTWGKDEDEPIPHPLCGSPLSTRGPYVIALRHFLFDRLDLHNHSVPRQGQRERREPPIFHGARIASLVEREVARERRRDWMPSPVPFRPACVVRYLRHPTRCYRRTGDIRVAFATFFRPACADLYLRPPTRGRENAGANPSGAPRQLPFIRGAFWVAFATSFSAGLCCDLSPSPDMGQG